MWRGREAQDGRRLRKGIRLCDEVKQKVSAYIRDATDFTPPTDFIRLAIGSPRTVG